MRVSFICRFLVVWVGVFAALVMVSTAFLSPAISWGSCATPTNIISNGYTGACGLTKSTTFTLSQDKTISNISVWYDTSIGGSSLAASLSGPNGYSKSASLTKSSACQWSWCAANWALDQTLAAGNYTLSIGSTSMCSDPSGKTTLVITGCAADTNTSTSTTTETTASTSADTISASEIASYIPDMNVLGGYYPIVRNYDPLGATGISLAGTKSTLSGNTLRLENIVVGDTTQAWLDFKLDLNDGVSFKPTGAAYGVPADLNFPAYAGIDFSISDVYLYGPPLSLAITPLRAVGGKEYFELLYSFGADAVFRPSGFKQIAAPTTSGTKATGKSVELSASKTIDQYISEQTLVEVGLPDDSTLGATLTKCMENMVNSIAGPYASDVMKALAKNSAMISEVKETMLTGTMNDTSLLITKYATKALIEAAPNNSAYAAALKNLNSYSYLASPAGSTCGGDWRTGLKKAIEGAAWKALPIATCGLKTAYDSAQMVRNWISDQEIRNQYNSWKNNEISLTLAGGPDLVASFKRKIETDQGRIISYTEAEQQIEKIFTKWQSAENSAPKRKAWLDKMHTQYDSLTGSQQSALVQKIVGTTGKDANKVSEAEKFTKYLEYFNKSRNQMSPFRPTDLNNLVTSDAMDGVAKQAVQSYLDNGTKSYQDFVAGTLQKWSPTTTTPPTTVCTAAATTTTTSGGGLSVNWDERQFHHKFAISGAQLNTPTLSDGFVSYKSYTGKLAGSTLTVSGSSSISSTNPSGGAGSGDYYTLSVKVTVGKNSKSFDYTAPKGEVLNQSFNLSVPIDAGDSSGSFSVALIENNYTYGNRGAVVSGTLTK